MIKPCDGRMGCNYVVARIVGTGGIQKNISQDCIFSHKFRRLQVRWKTRLSDDLVWWDWTCLLVHGARSWSTLRQTQYWKIVLWTINRWSCPFICDVMTGAKLGWVWNYKTRKVLRNEYYDLDYGHTLAGLSVWNQFMSSSYVWSGNHKFGTWDG